MLSMSNVSAAQAENYYEQDDYYTQDLSGDERQCKSTSASTQWYGKGATALGLSGEVSKGVFQSLLNGQDPQGRNLHARKIDPAKHRAATDYTFSAPKSVSIAGLIQGDERIIIAHNQAVETALSVLENRYVQTRISTPEGRQRAAIGNIVTAIFRHETSREQDPQFHSHCVVINATQLPDGTWRSVSNEEIVANQKLLGEIYQNELAYQVRQRGYEIEPQANGQFELKGYGQKLLETFSTRTQQIQEYIEKWEQSLAEAGGVPLHASQKKLATLNTRRKKRIIPREVLLKGWEQAIQSLQLEIPQLPQQERYLRNVSHINAAIAAREGIQHAAEREAVFRRGKVERFVLENHLGQQSFQDLQQAIANTHELIKADPQKDKYTTQTAIQRELETIRLMQQAKGQVKAIATLAEIAQPTVKGFAPSAEAANVLEHEFQIASDTVASLLHTKPDLTQRPLSGQEIWIVDEAGLLSAKDAHALLLLANMHQSRVLLVGDTKQLSAVEAGNPFKSLQAGGIQTAYLEKSLRQKTQVLKAAIDLMSQGRISEGLQQLDQVGAVQEIGNQTARLIQIKQDYLNLPPEERQRTLLLAGTNQERLTITNLIRKALQEEGRLGQDTFALSSLRSKDLTIVQARYAAFYEVGDVMAPTQDYKYQGLKKNQQYTVITKDWETNTLVLETPTGQLLTIDPARCDRKTVYQMQPIAIAPGDTLRWTKNNRNAGIRNGQTFTVAQIDAVGNAQIIDQLGQRTQVNLSGKQYVDYALVSTIYGSQGKTADRVLAAMDGVISRESLYVAASRAKYALTLYTADKAELARLAQASSANENVSDYIPLFQVVYRDGQTPQINLQSCSASADSRDFAPSPGDDVGQRPTADFRRTHHVESAHDPA